MLKRTLKLAVLISSAWAAQAMAGDITLFTGADFSGRDVTVRNDMRNLQEIGFNDRAASMVVQSGIWEVCVHADFGGECRVYEPGRYRNLDRLGGQISSLREVAGGGYGRNERDERRERRANRRGGRDAGLVLFDSTDLRGRSMIVHGDAYDMTSTGFNDRTQSMVVEGGTWEVCQHKDFGGACRVFGPGQYNNLDRAFHRSISSVRLVGNERGRGNAYGVRNGDEQRGYEQRGYDQRGDQRGYEQRGYEQRGAVELFSEAGFGGQGVRVQDEVRNLQSLDFNDRAGSMMIGSGEWELCEHADFRGRCMTYGPGRYDRLGNLHHSVSSLRRVR